MLYVIRHIKQAMEAAILLNTVIKVYHNKECRNVELELKWLLIVIFMCL